MDLNNKKGETQMEKDRAMHLLEKAGAILKGHFVYTSGKHGEMYINKDAVYPYTTSIHELCKAIALLFDHQDVQVVAGPEKGGIILSQRVAGWMQHWNVRSRPEIMAVYAEKTPEGFAFKRGYDKLIAGKRVLIPEDIINTGKTPG